MSLSDCEKCWDTPCTCGWDYRNWSIEGLTELRDILSGVIKLRMQGTVMNYENWIGSEKLQELGKDGSQVMVTNGTPNPQDSVRFAGGSQNLDAVVYPPPPKRSKG